MNFGIPDDAVALADYARLAAGYDESCRPLAPIREEAVALLGLRRGDDVLDVACGTGLSFPLLHAATGGAGSVVGVDLSPDMCDQARARAATLDPERILVVQGSAAEADFGATRFDAVLFHYTHDVLRGPAALANLFAYVKPGARVAVAGFKSAPGWALPLNLFSMFRARRYVSTFEGVVEPWSHLLCWTPDFRWRSRLAGTGYVGWGHRAAASTTPPPSAPRP